MTVPAPSTVNVNADQHPSQPLLCCRSLLMMMVQLLGATLDSHFQGLISTQAFRLKLTI